MRPLRLVIDGFGTYRHETEIDFTDVEFFALVGPTGSGKSTVIDALCFALYGTVPRWDNEKEVRNALAPSANACRVSVIFEVSGQRYVAVRALQRDKQGRVSTKAARLERLDASIASDAPLTEILEASVEQLAEGPDQVKNGVQELLGLSYEHFTQSVLLPQGGFSEFLRATPANRQRLLVELLAFGVYKEIGQRARERAQRADDQFKMAQIAREQLTDATPQAEEAARARLDSLTTLSTTVDATLAELAELDGQAAAARQLAASTEAEARLLSALHVPPEVPDLAQQIAAADAQLAQSRLHRDEAERAAEAASQARSQLPDKALIQRHLDNHALRQELTREADKQQAALAGCRAHEQQLAAELHAAEQAAVQAQTALETAQRAHAAAGLADSLHIGEDCPVCRQPIMALPQHEAPADFATARAALDTARTAERQARVAHQTAAQQAAAAQSKLDDLKARLDKAAQVMADVPSEADLAAQLHAIIAADDAVTGTRSAATVRQAELAAAVKARAALGAAEQQAWNMLSAERDKLVALGAPPAAQELAAAWTALADWARGEAAKRTERLPELSETAAKFAQQFADAAGALVGLLAEHDITDVNPISKIPAAVAEHRVRAENELRRVRDNIRQAAALDKQVAACKEEAQVASLLGNLLRATSFERWLCSEALDSLVTEASATLMELSGGQYELDRDERNDLVVIDYEDAGARRPVHTLSGGETFQASLALALALSRQVIGLSAGMRELNSMFLDEGFGTLDSDTLDTVASTLERLAADSDRMVGVITHVSELAERVPVRFVVNRTGSNSTIIKERVTPSAAPVTFSVDPWDPGYGMAYGEEMDGDAFRESTAELNLDLELPADQWRPLTPDPATAVPDTILFLDGVRRIDARVWVHGADPQPAPGIAASYAAGLVCCNGSAQITDVAVERGLFTAAAEARDLESRHGVYPARRAAGPGMDKLSLALQQRLSDTEVQLALLFRKENPDAHDLLFVDGPLRGRTHLDRTIGYIKTHHTTYLPPQQAAVVGALGPGERTPAFTMGTSWRRNSWYLRLPGASGAPWSGVVRLECSADLPTPEVTRLADLSARLLPPLASAAHKDPRAPQNLVPIGGLERELRRRLGDQQLLYRSLRAATSPTA